MSKLLIDDRRSGEVASLRQFIFKMAAILKSSIINRKSLIFHKFKNVDWANFCR